MSQTTSSPTDTEPSPWALWQLSDLTTPWALRVAVTLGLPDLLAEGISGPAALAERSGADEQAVTRLLRHLTARGVVDEPEPGRFALAPLGEGLRQGHPSRMAQWLDLGSAAGHMDALFAELQHSVRTGRAAYPVRHGREFYDDLAARPELQRSFDVLMDSDSGDYEQMMERDWSSARSVVDVGGGQGHLLRHLLQAHPHLRGTLVEMPATAEAGRAALESAGLTDRCPVVTGSFFDPLEAVGADVYVLASVLHNWNDDDAVAILGTVAAAAAPHSRIVVVEGVVDETADQRWATHLDLKMLVLLGGRERTVEDFAELARRAGLLLSDVRPASRGPFALRSALLELRHPPNVG